MSYSPSYYGSGIGEEVGSLVSLPEPDNAPVRAHSLAIGSLTAGALYLLTGIVYANPIVVYASHVFALAAITFEGVSRSL